jgi:hypothetical protein
MRTRTPTKIPARVLGQLQIYNPLVLLSRPGGLAALLCPRGQESTLPQSPCQTARWTRGSRRPSSTSFGETRASLSPILHSLSTQKDHRFSHVLPLYIFNAQQLEVSGFIPEGDGTKSPLSWVTGRIPLSAPDSLLCTKGRPGLAPSTPQNKALNERPRAKPCRSWRR